jgi:hypothetical protein
VSKRSCATALLLGLLCAALLAIQAAGQEPEDAWSVGPTTPFAWYRFDAEYYPDDGSVYFLGGGTSNNGSNPEIWRFNPVSQTFQNTGATLVQSVRNYRADVLPDGTPEGPGIYIVAGNPEAGSPLFVGPTELQVYYPSTNTAIMLATDPLPVCSDGFIIGGQAVVGNKLYVFGGWDGDRVLYDDTWQYDPAATAGERWTVIEEAHLAIPRTYITPAVYDGKIYAIGGDTWDGAALHAQTIVEVFDPYNPSAGWNDPAVADLPLPCDESQAFATPDGFILAGCGQWGGQLPDCLEYVSATNQWDTAFPDLNEARRNHASAQVSQSGLWIFGGIGEDGDAYPVTSSEFFPLAYTEPTYPDPPRYGAAPPPCDYGLSSISGRVIDEAGDPLPGVVVSAGPGLEATTSDDGTYTISNVVTGTHTLTPSRPCYTFSPPSLTVTVPPDADDQDFEASLPWGNLPGTWFWPSSDGYEFANWSSGVKDDLTESNLVQMFGSDCVCQTDDGGCEITSEAKAWRKKVIKTLRVGRCLGMSAASLRFFTSRDAHPGFATTYDLEKDSPVEHTVWDGSTWAAQASEHLTYHAALQFTLPLARDIYEAYETTPRQVLGTLCSLMVEAPDNPPYLVLRKSSDRKAPGHAVVPYAVAEAGDGVYGVSVYDPNHPGDLGHYVEVNIYDDTWTYEWSLFSTWSGDADSHTLAAVPVEAHDSQPQCDLGYGEQAFSGTPQGQVWLDGPGHLLITDQTGQRIGFLGEQYVEGMPGAFGLSPLGGLDTTSEPVYFVPLSDTHTILLDGQTLTQTAVVSVARFGPGYANLAENVILDPGMSDLLTVSSDGGHFSYEVGVAKEADLGLIAELEAASYHLTVAGADMGAAEEVSLFIEAPDGLLAFSNEHASGGSYGVSLGRVDASGEAAFYHSGLTIEATDTHYFDFGSWNGSGPMTLKIDHGSDGTIDETVELENQANRIYLPFVLRQSP